MTVFLEQLNNRCNDSVSVTCNSDGDCAGVGGPCGFAGYRDWRLPNVTELQSLVNYQVFLPAAFPAFNTGCSLSCDVTNTNTCSCTVGSIYWSSTTLQSDTLFAWTVSFSSGSVTGASKPIFNGEYARAVRGGS